MKIKYIYFYIGGGGGGPGGPLRQTQGYQIFRAVRPHHRADKCITRKKYNRHFFIYGPQCEEICIFGHFIHIWGGPGGALTSNPGLPNFQGSKISLQSRQIYKNK